MPQEHMADQHVDLYRPFQSVGAEGVNSLASKLLLALLPPNQPFFKLKADIDPQELGRLSEEQQTDFKGEIDKVFGKIERMVKDEIESNGLRNTLFETLKHLIVTGNALLYKPRKKKARLFHLDEYVIVRDNEGNLLEIIIKEELSPRTLPDEAREFVRTVDEHFNNLFGEGGSDDRTIALYTRIVRRPTKAKWLVYQEVKGNEVPKTRGHFRLDNLPYIPLRWTAIDGESYGRAYCELYLGDLDSLESLSQSLVEFGAAASKILFGVNPGGITDPDDLKAPSGSIVEADFENDVSVLSMEKFADMQYVAATADSIKQRLQAAFMNTAAVQRDAERVTAEEVRLVAQELEDRLGGVYSLFSDELQQPLIQIVLDDLRRQGKVQRLERDDAQIIIVTGLEALGRNRDLIRMEQLVVGTAEMFGPEEVSKWIKVGPFINRRATALGIDIEGVIRTEEEVAQINQQQQMAALAEKAAPNAVNQLGEAAQARQQGQGA
jgi:hypothetical protein